jgi:diketogulonate reductase-like aldo/keto reductase
VEFVQIDYSVAERAAERHLLPYCLENGIAVIANRPLGGGALLQALGAKPLPPLARELDCESWSELLLKFVVSHPAITCAIPATSSADHVRENVRAAFGPMPDERMRLRILQAAEGP